LQYKCSNAKVPRWRFLMKTSPFTAVEFRLNQSELRTYTKVSLLKKKFFSLCCIVTNTEWNGIIKLTFEVKCIRIILSPNLIDLAHFLKRPWFLYVLSKYQAMFKVLQWNARLWKIPTPRKALSSPRNSLFIVHASNPQYPIKG
jgi:hypothetical protein